MPVKKPARNSANPNDSPGNGHDDENVIQPFKQSFHILDEVVDPSQAESSSAEAHEPVVTAIPESKLPPQGAATSTPPSPYGQSYTQAPPPVNPPPPTAASSTPGSAPAPPASTPILSGSDILRTAARATIWCGVALLFHGIFDPDDIFDS